MRTSDTNNDGKLGQQALQPQRVESRQGKAAHALDTELAQIAIATVFFQQLQLLEKLGVFHQEEFRVGVRCPRAKTHFGAAVGGRQEDTAGYRWCDMWL